MSEKKEVWRGKVGRKYKSDLRRRTYRTSVSRGEQSLLMSAVLERKRRGNFQGGQTGDGSFSKEKRINRSRKREPCREKSGRGFLKKEEGD